MANLIPVSRFDDVVALDKGNPIIGARLGMSNKQAQQLLNRMTYIRESIEQSIDDAHDEFDDSIYELDLTERALKQRMDNIEEKSDVVDVVATYSDILNYDTSSLNLNDIVKCLGDSNHAGVATYYRWIGTGFSFIGYERKSTPILITSSQSVTPIRATVYVLSGSNISLTIGSGSYTGISVTVGSLSSGTNHIITSTDDFILDSSPEWIRLVWNGSKWCPDVPHASFDKTYPIGTVIISAVNSSPVRHGTWTQIPVGNIIITAGQNYNPEVNYGSDTQSYTVTGSVESTVLTAAQCPAHYHTGNNASVVITVAAGTSGSHTHSARRASGDGSSVTGFSSEDTYTLYNCTSATFYTGNNSHTHSAYNGSASAVGSGGGHTHTFSGASVNISVVQPYINLFMFKRTS